MESYELTFDQMSQGNGITAISLVGVPAILVDWLAFNDKNPQPIQFKSVDDDKQMIAGPVMIPNLDILRVHPEGHPQAGEKYTVFYTPETVAKLNEDFIKAGRHASTTMEHQMTLNGVTVLETWIIEDPKKDKASHYGFSLPVGTWMVVMKVDDPVIWKEVKEGKIKGFSIEGFFGEKKSTDSFSDQSGKDINKFLNMLKTKIGEAVRLAFGDHQEENKPDQMGSVSVTDTESNAVELIFAGDALTVGTEVRITNEAGTEELAKDGIYTAADGTLWTVADGKIVENAEAEAEEEAASEAMSAEKVEAMISKATGDLKKSISGVLEQFGAMIDQENESSLKEIKDLKTKLSTFAATDPIPDKPEGGEEEVKRVSFKDAAKAYKENHK